MIAFYLFYYILWAEGQFQYIHWLNGKRARNWDPNSQLKLRVPSVSGVSGSVRHLSALFGIVRHYLKGKSSSINCAIIRRVPRRAAVLLKTMANTVVALGLFDCGARKRNGIQSWDYTEINLITNQTHTHSYNYNLFLFSLWLF